MRVNDVVEVIGYNPVEIRIDVEKVSHASDRQFRHGLSNFVDLIYTKI